jgi:hypothetical protein
MSTVSLLVSQRHEDILFPGNKFTVSGNCLVSLDIQGTETKKALAAGESFTFHRYMQPVKVKIEAFGSVTITKAVDSDPVAPVEFLAAQVDAETEHLSPNQYGGYFGTVYRQYHGAKADSDTITATGITKLIAAGGRYETIKCYNGDVLDGTNSLIISKGTDVVDFTISGAGAWTCDEGWVDYVK